MEHRRSCGQRIRVVQGVARVNGEDALAVVEVEGPREHGSGEHAVRILFGPAEILDVEDLGFGHGEHAATASVRESERRLSPHQET